MMEINTIFTGDVMAGLAKIDDKTVNCVVTSPPYWNLRDYGVAGQLGLEKTPEEYVAKMVAIFHEIKRVLRDDGTVWLNLGDSYAGYWGDKHGHKQFRKADDDLVLGDPSTVPNKASLNFAKHRPSSPTSSTLQGSKKTQIDSLRSHENGSTPGLKPKDLIGIPWMVAFALRADGWWLRQDIIWAKKNCMPESVTDRCTKSHEYIFMLSKSQRYYYDQEAIKEPALYDVDGTGTQARKARQKNGAKSLPTSERAGIRQFKDASLMNGKNSDKQRGHSRRHNGFNDRWDQMTHEEQCTGMRNKRDVWTISPAQFKEAHFATFPPDLIIDCIKAGCPVDGLVLDPFMGAGTSAIVARKLNRNYLGIELNPKYVEIAQNRLYKELGMFL